MKVLVTGGSGLVGSVLVPALVRHGHSVIRLVRREPRGDDEVRWDPEGGRLDAARLEGTQAVVGLAGENIASGRWTVARKQKIRDSRVFGTGLLAKTISRLVRPPEVFVSASAIGFYGDRGDEILTEESRAGSGFLADVCQEWEGATATAAQKGIRVVCLRFGVILSASGGALAKMLPPLRLGLGGKIGSGDQFVSWISIDDAVGVILHTLRTELLKGPVNAVSPNPVTNLQFTKGLGKVLRRPTIFPMPAFAARLVLGEMADELLLASTRVEPHRLQMTGYPFRHPEINGTLRELLES